MDDEAIVELFWRRDERAVAQAQAKYGAYCLAVAARIVSREDAEECVNDTWARAWNAIPPQRPASLRLFLARIARNLALNRREALAAEKRGNGEAALVLDELAECLPGGRSVEASVDARELSAGVGRFVRALPARDAGVFVRRYFFAETAAEIGARYGLSENHVHVILGRTRKKLKAYLTKEGFR